jgi:hypothetical protein
MSPILPEFNGEGALNQLTTVRTRLDPACLTSLEKRYLIASGLSMPYEAAQRSS